MATHQKKAFITYGALIDFLCPAGKDLILSYDLGSDYATKLAAMFPETTWSQKTTVKCGDITADGVLTLNAQGTDTVCSVRLNEEMTGQYQGKPTKLAYVSGGGVVSTEKNWRYASGLSLDNQYYAYHRLT